MHGLRVNQRFTLAIALVTSSLAACSSSTDTTITTSANLDLTGTWTATKYQFVSINHVGTTFDLPGQGYTVTLVGTASTWNVTATKNGALFDTEIGTYTSTSSTISLTTTNKANNVTAVFTASRSGNTITMSNGTATFDFGTGNGTEPVTLNITIVKQ